MSYDIYIGNAELETPDPDEDGGVLTARMIVRHHEEPDAPTFPGDETTKNGNSRHPGYLQWDNFCGTAGLRALFFDEATGLMREHPGTVALGPEHLATVRSARERWERRHPGAVPGWDWPGYPAGADDGVRGRDGVLARLLWLEWWMDYALRTCERPAIHNH